MFAVTESVVKRGDVSTDQMWTLFAAKSFVAADGNVYSKYGYGTSLLAAPLYALALYVPFSGLMQVTLLSSALVTALTGALIVLAARRLHYSPRVSVIVALLFGLAGPAWVYAKEFWSEQFAALTLFAAFYFLLRYRDGWNTRDALFAGICLGLAIAVRTTNALLVPLYLAYGFVSRTPSKENTLLQWRSLLRFLGPILLFLVSVMLYNAVRFQNPFTTGYRADEDFSNNIFLGAYGLLFSPGKGLFVYAPFLAALPFGVWQFYRTQRRELVFTVLLFTAYCLLFSAWYYWWGGTNWAARFLVPTLPFLALLCAPLVQVVIAPLSSGSRFTSLALRVTWLILVAVSFVNELAGVAVNSLTYRSRLANVSTNADWDSIFIPMLSPLIGHWQTLKPTNFDVAWLRATGESISPDWLVLVLTLSFLLLSAWGVRQSLRGRLIILRVIFAFILLAGALTIFSLGRYADDPRLGGGSGYAELMETLAHAARARDILILNDDAQARFFFNRNRTPLKWYGLSRDPARWDNTTQTAISQELAQAPRAWFAYDEQSNVPNPMRDWFAANFREIRRFEFEKAVILIEYDPS